VPADPLAWKVRGGKIKYVNRSPDAPSGILALKAKAIAIAGESAASMKGAGVALELPPAAGPEQFFAQDSSVVVQLVNSTNACWSTEFLAGDTKKNAAKGFKAVFQH